MDKQNAELFQLVAKHIENGVTNHKVVDLFCRICEIEGLDDLAADVRRVVHTTGAVSPSSDWCLAALIRIGESEQRRLADLARSMDDDTPRKT